MSKVIEQGLNQLAKLRSEWEMLNLEKQAAIDKIIPLEFKQLIDQIQKSFEERTKLLENKISCLEQEIKLETVNCGSTIKGLYLQAVFSNGIVTWDSKGLEEYAKSQPELLQFRKQGNAFVSIRKLGKQHFSISKTCASKHSISGNQTDSTLAA